MAREIPARLLSLLEGTDIDICGVSIQPGGVYLFIYSGVTLKAWNRAESRAEQSRDRVRSEPAIQELSSKMNG